MNDLGTRWSRSFSLEAAVFLVTKHVPAIRATKPTALPSVTTSSELWDSPSCTNPPLTSAEDSQWVWAFVLSAPLCHTILVLPPWKRFLLLSPKHCLVCCSSHLKTSHKASHIDTTSSGNQLPARKAPVVPGCRSACSSEQGVSTWHIHNPQRPNMSLERTWGDLHQYLSQGSLQSTSILLHFLWKQQNQKVWIDTNILLSKHLPTHLERLSTNQKLTLKKRQKYSHKYRVTI